MIIDCISDVHGHKPSLPGGDLLIVAGDITADHRDMGHFVDMCTWISEAPYERKIVIAGNHDAGFESIGQFSPFGFEYLQDSGTEAFGLKIWGSPWTLPFCNWFFEKCPSDMKKAWGLIPDDIDILITHSPPRGVKDRGPRGARLGCPQLMAAVDRVKPKLHVFGHIHESAGRLQRKDTLFINAAYLDGHYNPANEIQRVDL